MCLTCFVCAVQVHAENGEGVALGQQLVFDAGITGPEGHALSRPAVLEGEATARAIKLASFVGVPLYVVHVMSKDALEEVSNRNEPDCGGVTAGRHSHPANHSGDSPGSDDLIHSRTCSAGSKSTAAWAACHRRACRIWFGP